MRIASGVAAADGDCAIATWQGKWYTYYINSINRVYRLVSTDNGLTWSAPTLVRACSRAGFVAAAGNWVFCQEHQVHAYVSDPNTSALSGPFTQVSPTTNGGHGLAATRDAAPGDSNPAAPLRLLFTVKGDVWAVTFDPVARAYGAARRVAPGADQEPAGAADYRYPALCCVSPGQLVATWIERHDASLTGESASWRYPVARISLGGASAGDEAHLGSEVPLAAPGETIARMAALFDATEQTVYLGNDRLVLTARTYSEDPVWCMRFGPEEVPEYTLSQRANQPATLTVALADREGEWPYLGVYRYAEAPLCPLAEVTLERGYDTAAGRETVALPPFYVTRVQRTEGQEGGWVRLTCTDALGLLALWRAPEALLWKGRAIRWLLAELCARVGLRYRDAGEAALGRTVPLFALPAGQAALDGVLALLRLGGCVARVHPDGALQPLPWPQGASPTMTIGANGEVRRGAFGLQVLGAGGLRPATNVRISSGGAYAEGEAIADAWALGLRLTEALHDERIGLDTTMAATVRDRELALAALGWRADEATIPLRVDLDLWDAATLHCAATERVGEAQGRIVTGLCERRVARTGVAELEVTLGRA
ncbi:MAG: hypothetical protein ABFD20_10070 [Anaerolineales bacterium]